MDNAKDYLKQVRLIDMKIASLLDEVYQLREMLTKVTPTLKDDAGFGGGSQDKMSGVVAKIVDLEAEINADVYLYVDMKKKIRKTLEGIKDPDQYRLLILRYFEYHTLEKIACEMNYTYRNVCYIHGKALQAVERILNDG